MNSGFDFPKIELHLHLDGAIAPSTLFRLANERKIELPAESAEDLVPYVVNDASCRSVNEYLTKFDLPTRVLQDSAALDTVAYELVLRLAAQGCGYAEIRFAPQLHTQKLLCQSDAIAAVVSGVRRALAECAGIKIGVILCCMALGGALLNREANLETVRLASEMRDDIIRGIDLAGAEGLCPLEDYAELFDLAQELGVPFTCHAGDSQGPDTVRAAIERFGARRIGHGHHIAEDEELCKKAKNLGVTLEICLTSNIQCETQPSFAEHPAKKLFDAGIAITLSSDNPIIADTTLEDEYRIAVEKCGFTHEDIIDMNINAVRASFMDEADKSRYIDRLRQFK